MPLREAIESWREFYSASANVGAALVGLVFVGVSIHLSSRRLDTRTRLLGLEAAMNLLHPLIASLTMLVPLEPAVQGVGLLVLALVNLPVMVGITYSQTRTPGHERWHWLVYRYGLPLIAEVILILGGVGLVVGWESAVYAPAAFVFLTLVVGSQNAWDLLLGSAPES